MERRSVTHFELIEKLGAGGMGVVYKARDVLLDRIVALKFLPAHLSSDDRTRTRLLREARAAANLTHDNICTIYEVGESEDGQPFIAMAYYDGNALRDLLRSDDDSPVPLEAEEAFRIALAVGRGLQSAHEQGIAHRDIKPENVMVTERGDVKILDFGLAKIAHTTQITAEGAAVGTIAYMSPEQARGELVDHRTDIWSLGVMLYEMLAGRSPFQGVYDQAIIYSILNEDPLPVSKLVTGLPDGVDDVVARALSKNADYRWGTAAQLCDAIELLSQGGTVAPFQAVKSISEEPDDISIAVLPLDDMGSNGHGDYFADGLTEELISDLSKIQQLRVISRGSSMVFKGSKGSSADIGRQLGVRYLVDGSVQRSGSAVRIHMQLIEAASNVNVWSDKYRGTVDDVFDLQETVSRSVAEALQLKLTSSEAEQISYRPIDSFAAYDSYLHARSQMWSMLSEEAVQETLNHLDRGLEIVGDNELLFAGLAYTHWQAVNNGVRPATDLDRAVEYTEKVFELNPESHHGYRMRGLVSALGGELQAAAKALRRAYDEDANDPDTLFWLALIYISAGRIVDAAPLVDRLLQIDPLNPVARSQPGYIHLLAGRFDLAVEPFGMLHDAAPDNPVFRFFYGLVLAFAGRKPEAEGVLEPLTSEAAQTFFGALGSFFLSALRGQRQQAEEAVTPVVSGVASSDFQYSWILACGYALIGDKNNAIDWLENSVARGFINFPYLALCDPFLAALRDDVRFQELMEQVKAKWRNFEL
ncbi:MAG: protein kinase [Rhodothermia bacterium]|nr:protein kinase [Rhodothermia bacterium]